MNPFDYIMIEHNFVPENICDIMIQITAGAAKPAVVFQNHETQGENKSYRDTNIHDIPFEHLDNLTNTIAQIHDTKFRSRYNTTLRTIEPPQLLSYGVGGHYDEHNDCEDFVDNRLKRIVDRDISVIFYLNDDYVGGEIEFTQLGLLYKPRKGSMLAFPSYYEFSHRVHPVTSGTRVCLVTWLGTEKRIYERTV